MIRLRAVALALASCSLLGYDCSMNLPDDPMLDGEAWSPDLLVAEMVPLVPWIEPGPDRLIGTLDDTYAPSVQGDVDLVLRTGATSIGAEIPAPRAAGGPSATPLGVAEPFAEGTPIEFVVAPSDGKGPDPWGRHGVPPYWEGLPVLVVAFADLDGDGFVGVTLLDGDPLDEAIEEAVGEPGGRRFALGSGGVAAGALAVEVGGPPARPARVALAAAAWAGPTEPGYLGGNVPRGPGVMTRLPFWPELRPERVLEGGAQGPPAAQPDSLVGVEVRPAIAPDPSDPRVGESFTLRLDGSDPTLDVARVVSGAAVRFGLAMRPDPATYRALPQRPLRPGVDAAGALEILHRLPLADDGSASQTEVRVLALDRLDNAAVPSTPESVTVTSGGTVRIVSPDADGDPLRETVVVATAAGAVLVLDDPGGAFDGADADRLVVASADGLAHLPVFLPDPDVDDSGLVDDADLDAIVAARRLQIDEPGYDPRLDLDGSGRIDDDDRDLAEASLGDAIPVP